LFLVSFRVQQNPLALTVSDGIIMANIPSRGQKMALSDVKAKNAKGREKPYKLTDTGGLYLLVMPAGGKYWRFDYRYDGKRKTLALGTYPEISLLDARSRVCDARKAIAHGIEPRRAEEGSEESAGRY
jgi:hypothetical protein